MVEHTLTQDRLDKLLDKLYSLGLKTKLKLAINQTLKIGLSNEDVPLSSELQTRAFDLTSEEISDRLAIDFAEELLRQFRIVAEEDERENGPRRRKGSVSGSTGDSHNAGNGSSGGGQPDPEAKPNENNLPPLTIKEVFDDLTNFAKRNKSSFKFGGKVLEDMAERVAAKGREIQHSLGLSDRQLVGLARVSLYDIVFLCDDSGSMQAGDRIPALIRTLQSVADWATRLEPTGISIRFLNHTGDGDGDFDNLTHLKDIKDVCHKVKFEGNTYLGEMLRKKILNRRIMQKQRVGLTRPLIVAVITDGEPTDLDRDSFRKTILEFKTQFEEGSAVFILFQVGKAPDATKFRKKMALDKELQDTLYCSGELLIGIDDFLSKALGVLTEEENAYKRLMLDEFIKAIDRGDES